jgi:hypothetical protein
LGSGSKVQRLNVSSRRVNDTAQGIVLAIIAA